MMWNYWAEDWLLFHNVIFDGINKRIYLNESISQFSVKRDLYSAWKEWVRVRDHAKYEQALRTIGGDPVGGGQYAGDMFFLVNDWQIVVDHPVQITGILYHDNQSLSPYIVMPGGGVISAVSNLAYAYNTTGQAVPTVSEISAEVWNAAAITSNTTGSMGEKLNQVATHTSTISNEFQTVNMKLDSLPIGVSAQIVVDLQDEIAAINTIPTLHTEIAAVPGAVRTNLSTELAHVMTLQNGQGLDSTQATMLLEIYRLYGLDPTMPLVVTNTSRTAGPINQSIDIANNSTTVTRG